jgi:hypothetical protein
MGKTPRTKLYTILLTTVTAFAALLFHACDGKPQETTTKPKGTETMSSFYDFSLTAMNGETVKMADYKGKVVLVVNTATGCGFTPQYAPIEQLYLDYHDKGLEILDIPCNQFGAQAPGTDEEIHNFCTLH